MESPGGDGLEGAVTGGEGGSAGVRTEELEGSHGGNSEAGDVSSIYR